MEFQVGSGIVSAILSILIVSLFIHFGAKPFTHDAGFLRAVFVAIVGSLLATVVWGALGGTLGLIVAVAVWALVAAVTYRTSWLAGLMIGVVAWILWAIVSWLIALIF